MEFCKPILGDKQGNVRLRILQMHHKRLAAGIYLELTENILNDVTDIDGTAYTIAVSVTRHILLF